MPDDAPFGVEVLCADLLLFEILISDPDDDVECLLFEICCCPVYWETQHWKSKHTLDQCCAGSLYIIFDPIIGLQQSYSLLIRQRTNWRCWQSSWRSWRSRLNTQQVRKNAPKASKLCFFGPPEYISKLSLTVSTYWVALSSLVRSFHGNMFFFPPY